MQKTSVDILRSVELEIQNRYISFQSDHIYIYIYGSCSSLRTLAGSTTLLVETCLRSLLAQANQTFATILPSSLKQPDRKTVESLRKGTMTVHHLKVTTSNAQGQHHWKNLFSPRCPCGHVAPALTVRTIAFFFAESSQFIPVRVV